MTSTVSFRGARCPEESLNKISGCSGASLEMSKNLLEAKDSFSQQVRVAIIFYRQIRGIKSLKQLFSTSNLGYNK